MSRDLLNDRSGVTTEPSPPVMYAVYRRGQFDWRPVSRMFPEREMAQRYLRSLSKDWELEVREVKV